jgi:D-alanyl-D-alanine endopeptidase (penicillin-binding protein 7)
VRRNHIDMPYFKTDPYFKKIIFFLAIIGVGLVSRVAYEVNSNSAAATNPAAKSLALAAPDVASDSSADSGAFLRGGVLGISADASVTYEINNAVDSNAAVRGNSSVSRSNVSALSGLQYEAALVADLQTGAISFGDNDGKRWPLASVTKLMTAAVVMDNFDMDQKITITPDAFAVDPSEKTLRAGDAYTASDLLRFLLLPSSNVAAEAFADSYGRALFIAAMNARAAMWGMANTHYDDPSGLSSGNQSTADNLLLLAQKIYSDYPKVLAITRTTQATATELGSGKKTFVKSINDFAGEADFIGGKTGYTNIADGNLLSIFKYNGRPILVVVLGTDETDRFINTEKLFDWFKGQSQ